jgi:hypothetical protein
MSFMQEFCLDSMQSAMQERLKHFLTLSTIATVLGSSRTHVQSVRVAAKVPQAITAICTHWLMLPVAQKIANPRKPTQAVEKRVKTTQMILQSTSFPVHADQRTSL